MTEDSMISVSSLRHPTIQTQLLEAIKHAVRESRINETKVGKAMAGKLTVFHRRGSVESSFQFYHRFTDVTSTVLKSLREGHVDENSLTL